MIKILSQATEEESAVIFATIQALEKDESNIKKTHVSKWKSYGRRKVYDRNLWEKDSLSFWQLEARKLD